MRNYTIKKKKMYAFNKYYEILSILQLMYN